MYGFMGLYLKKKNFVCSLGTIAPKHEPYLLSIK